MAKGAREKIKLESSAGTGHFYTTTKNKRNMPEKMLIKKFDPVARKHVDYKETKLKYTVCLGDDMKLVHMYMSANYLGVPKSKPDSLMMKLPIFTTWSFFFRNINQSVVLDYANQIKQHNYSISQLEIDDKWEASYGE